MSATKRVRTKKEEQNKEPEQELQPQVETQQKPMAEQPSEFAKLSTQISEIQRHLGFLEKKLDILVNQSQNKRPFQGGEQRQGHFRSFDRGNRPFQKPNQFHQRSGGGHDRGHDHRSHDRHDRGGSRDWKSGPSQSSQPYNQQRAY